MKRTFSYLLALMLFYGWVLWKLAQGEISLPNETFKIIFACGISGGIGGVLYCFRGIYLNACVYKQWDSLWLPWYFIRPIVSFLSGAISCLFLKAGLIIFEAQQTTAPSYLVFYALAFVAGLNVDKFIEKIEDIAQVTWGIKKSRTALKDSHDVESKNPLS